MTRRELVIEALEHRATDIVPYHLEFTQQALESMIEYTGDPNIEQKLGTCLHYCQFWGWPTELPDKPGYFRDIYGVEWNRNGVDKDIGLPDEYLIEDLEECDYEFPEVDEARLRAEYEQLIATKEDKFCFVGFGFVMFERLWSLLGMENALMSMVACPEELDAFMQKIGDHYLKLLDIALEYDIDAVYFGDDWGMQKGLIMGPDHWRRFIKPQMARLYAKIKAAGKYVIQHSCGDCHEVLGDLVEIGLDCYQTFQPEVYDIVGIKEKYGDRLAFWGAVSTQVCLPFTDPEGVRKECKRVADILRKDGGFIIGPTHAMTHDIPPENILALAEVFHNQEKYL